MASKLIISETRSGINYSTLNRKFTDEKGGGMLVKGLERMKLIRVEVSINQFDLGFESEETFRLSRLASCL